MTALLVSGLICFGLALFFAYLAGDQDYGGVVGIFISIIMFGLGLFLFNAYVAQNYSGYASKKCESGTYHLSTADVSND